MKAAKLKLELVLPFFPLSLTKWEKAREKQVSSGSNKLYFLFRHSFFHSAS